MAGSLVINYLAQGAAASRPAAPTAATGTLSFYFSTDTETLSYYDWNDGAWQDVPTSSLTAATTTEQLTGTSTTVASTPDSVAALWEQGGDIASAGTISIGEGGYFHVTGTTTITDIDFGVTKAGRIAMLVFDGALILTHNATTLILPTGANITTVAGDSCIVVSEGGDNVRVLWYQRKDGTPLVAGYTDEMAQDAVGGIVTGLYYNDGTPALSVIRVAQIQVTDPNGDALTTGDGKAYFRVNSQLDGYDLFAVAAQVTTVSSSGTPTVQINNVTQAADMLSTKLTIDANEVDSSTAAVPAVIDAANDDVATADQLRIDVDVAGTGTKGLIVELTFRKP